MQQYSPLPYPYSNSQQFEISQTAKTTIIRIKLSQKALRILSNELSNHKFEEIKNTGKYSTTKYSFLTAYNNTNKIYEKYMEIVMDKYYYFKVLANKKYQTLIFARTYLSGLEDFFVNISGILKGDRLFKPGECQLIKLDAFSITIFRNFQIKNYKNQLQIKKVFIKMSPFLYRRNPYIRPKQCQQFFSAIVVPSHKNPLSKQIPECPTDLQFFQSPRVSYIDDMYSNQSFTKRFPYRFLLFYQANSLFTGQASIDHKFVKEFYQKCAHRCSFNAMRLKKMSFNLKIPSVDRDKMYKFALFMYCYEDDSANVQIQLLPDPQCYEKYHMFQNFTALNQAFLKHLKQSLNNPNNPTQPTFIQMILPSVNKQSLTGFKISNQVGICRLLCQLNFFLDRIIYRNLTSKILNQSYFKQQCLEYKLPPTQQHKIKKYTYTYNIQLKSLYLYRQINRHPYQNIISRIIMSRRKSKDNKDNNNQIIQFNTFNTEQLRGLVCYVNQMFKKWNVSDCFMEVNLFIGGYLNVIVDKNKDKTEKSMYKGTTQWKIVIQGLSALIESLTKSFNTEDTTITLHILRTYEDSRKSEQITRSQISQGQQVMLMTFKYYKITNIGWIQIIPTCLYYFQMYKDYTRVYVQGDKGEEIGIRSSKEQIQKIFKGYIKRTLNFKCQLPAWQYGYAANSVLLNS